MRIKRLLIGTLLFLQLLVVSQKCLAFLYQDFEVPRSTFLAELFIWALKPASYLYRSFWHPGVSSREVSIDEQNYTYLIRPGERDGVMVMVHGVLSRKEFFLSLITELAEQPGPLPTIIVPDLLGHGSQPYPENLDFSVRAFVRHLAVFVKHMQQEYWQQKLVVLGHSLGGGFSLLLRPLAGIDPDGLILLAPAGLPASSHVDLKSRIEQADGLPFDFGSAAITGSYYECFEPPGTIFSALLWLGGHLYEAGASPYETWMKNRLFRDLEVSRKQLMLEVSPEQVLEENLAMPVHLFWMHSDRLFNSHRYKQIAARYPNGTGIHYYEERGGHLWVYEHSEEAAARISPTLELLLNSDFCYCCRDEVILPVRSR